MTDEIEETGKDRQADLQAREQQRKYAESATAVSPDTQFADPGQIGDDARRVDLANLASRGQSTVFSDPAKPRASSNVDQGPSGYEEPRPPGRADEDRNPDQSLDGAGGDADQDAEPTTPTGEEQPAVGSDDTAAAQTSYGEDQDAAPSQAPYEQQ